jgi:hypothetical protein
MSAEWTLEPKTCAFCKKEPDNGYALPDKEGKWQPACWPCTKKRLKTLQEEDPAQGF